MAVETGFLAALAAMACTAYASRVAGFLLMGYVPITPRVEAALKAMPLGVMIGIVMPTVLRGALAVVGVVMKLGRNDLVAALAGVATIALCRWLLPA